MKPGDRVLATVRKPATIVKRTGKPGEWWVRIEGERSSIARHESELSVIGVRSEEEAAP